MACPIIVVRGKWRSERHSSRATELAVAEDERGRRRLHRDQALVRGVGSSLNRWLAHLRWGSKESNVLRVAPRFRARRRPHEPQTLIGLRKAPKRRSGPGWSEIKRRSNAQETKPSSGTRADEATERLEAATGFSSQTLRSMVTENRQGRATQGQQDTGPSCHSALSELVPGALGPRASLGDAGDVARRARCIRMSLPVERRRQDIVLISRRESSQVAINKNSS